jgi:hypothetical protein
MLCFLRAYLGWALKYMSQKYLYLFIAILCTKMALEKYPFLQNIHLNLEKLLGFKSIKIIQTTVEASQCYHFGQIPVGT